MASFDKRNQTSVFAEEPWTEHPYQTSIAFLTGVLAREEVSSELRANIEKTIHELKKHAITTEAARPAEIKNADLKVMNVLGLIKEVRRLDAITQVFIDTNFNWTEVLPTLLCPPLRCTSEEEAKAVLLSAIPKMRVAIMKAVSEKAACQDGTSDEFSAATVLCDNPSEMEAAFRCVLYQHIDIFTLGKEIQDIPVNPSVLSLIMTAADYVEELSGADYYDLGKDVFWVVF